MSQARVLVIGGPQGAQDPIPGVERIGADFISVLTGPSRPICDYDFVVYWPGEAGLALPGTHLQWQRCREMRWFLPEIPPAYWAARPEPPIPFLAPPTPAPRGGTRYAPHGSLCGGNMLAPHRALLLHFNEALRPIIAATESGQICLCALPPVMPPGLAGSAMEWLSPYLQWSQVRREQDYLDPERLPNNPVVGLLASLAPILRSIATFRVDHTPTSLGIGHQNYGRFFWDEILFSGDREDVRPDCEQWPQQQHIVEILPGHTSRIGDPKSLLFLAGPAGGVAVMPEPTSLQAMIDRLPGAPGSHDEDTARGSALLKMLNRQVTIPFSRDSRIQSLEHLAVVIDKANTQEEAMAPFCYRSREDFEHILNHLKKKKKIYGARDVLARFVDAAKQRIRSLPPK